MIRLDERNEDLQVNMTPMIDMVFLLIIFFLTATTFTRKEREHEVELPSSRVAGSPSKAVEKNLIVNVLKDGEIVVGEKRYSEKELERLVAERRQLAGPGFKVKVRGDRRAPYGLVTPVFQAVKRAGVARPMLDTEDTVLDGRPSDPAPAGTEP
jgi:biopolymer transport protein ExbD